MVRDSILPTMKAPLMMSRMMRLVTAGISLLVAPAFAQTTPPTQVQPQAPGLRKLTGDDAKRADELDKAIATALKADRWGETIARTDDLLALRSRAQGLDHFERAVARWHLTTFRKVAAMGDDDRAAFRSAWSLGEEAEALFAAGKYAEAQPLFERSLQLFRRLFTDEDIHTASSYSWLASNLKALGKYTDADPLFEKALENHRRQLGYDHPYTAADLSNFASNLDFEGKYGRAEPLHKQALEIRRRLFTDEHADTAATTTWR
jgi:tetratricopeptide (TPR) repeat protein